MRKFLTAAVMLATGLGAVAPAMAADAPMCLRSIAIDNTRVPDARTILFRMRDGKVYRNTLKTDCNSLLFNGFAYVTNFGEICANVQTIRVLRTGQVCQLGSFTQEPPHHV